jgi:hypothetical protein
LLELEDRIEHCRGAGCKLHKRGLVRRLHVSSTPTHGCCRYLCVRQRRRKRSRTTDGDSHGIAANDLSPGELKHGSLGTAEDGGVVDVKNPRHGAWSDRTRIRRETCHQIW